MGIAAGIGATLGGVIGALSNRCNRDRAARTFEKNRIAALERGLELQGEARQPRRASSRAPCWAANTASGSKIGSGGIGVVYAAEHIALGHEVAVKVLRGAAAKDGGEIARLRREAYIQVHIEHPNVVRVLDLDQMPDGSIYVVMERLRGISSPTSSRATDSIAPGLRASRSSSGCAARSRPRTRRASFIAI